MKTLTIPHHTARFDIKVGQHFHLRFNEDGQISHHDSSHFDPVLPNTTVGPGTPESTHEALQIGDVDIKFIASGVEENTFSMHTIHIES
jgi:hypothetical protein